MGAGAGSARKGPWPGASGLGRAPTVHVPRAVTEKPEEVEFGQTSRGPVRHGTRSELRPMALVRWFEKGARAMSGNRGWTVGLGVCLAAVLAGAAHADWGSLRERPPQKGVYFYVRPLPPSVNYLVPPGSRHRYFKPQPWTPAWFEYCARKWDSFDPRTGTVVTPDGIRMCF